MIQQQSQFMPRAKFRLEFAAPEVRDKWCNALFANSAQRCHGPLIGRVLAEIGEIAVLAPPGRSFHMIDIGAMEWLHTGVFTRSGDPGLRLIESVEIYGEDANRRMLANVRTTLENIIANMRREKNLASPEAGVLRSRLGFLYTVLDILGRALFLCKADASVQDRLIAGVEESAVLFSTGKLSFEQADRKVRRLLAPVQKHLPMSA